ncbi:MAG: PLP-dependent aminotransferase family protein [Candidatus Latescibacteria bacterium]|jgi:2-aminoadipate transaminase|nr:PLP-dependent aminotransferase family protein [Candidatus Latescibacterota bacterium]
MREYNFGSGRPDPLSFPSEGLAEAAARVIADHGSKLVDYPEGKGYLPLREIAAMRFERSERKSLPVEDIALTSGSMQALQLLSEAYVKPGEIIVTESFTYGGSLGLFRRRQARLVGVPMDDHGMIMSELEATLKRLADQGTKPGFIYTIASHQNPTGSIMPVERREQLLEIARRYDVLVVDDHCYGDIIFDMDQAAPTLYTLDDSGTVVYIGSFSKILGPGVRQGYFAAPPSRMNQMLHNKVDGGTNMLASMIVAEYFKDHLWSHLAMVNRVMQERRDTMTASLAEHFGPLGPAVQWSNPPGGLFIWVKVPDDVDIAEAVRLAGSRGVVCPPGRAFSPEDEDVPYLRLAFGYPSVPDIRDGIPILADCVKAASGVRVEA